MKERLKVYRQFKILMLAIKDPRLRLVDCEIIWADDKDSIVGYKIEIKVEDKPKLQIIKKKDDD